MRFLVKLILACTSVLSIAVLPSQGVQLADGTTSFVKSPRLLNAVTTFSTVYVWAAKYYFNMALPADVGEPLRKVTFHQRQGFEQIDFQLDRTLAFEGTNRNRGKPLTIQEVTLDQQTNTISVVFDPPLEPGTNFTVSLKPYRNPQFEGVYLFGVTAYPVGDKPLGLYLGVGRLQFYRWGGSW